MDLSSASIRHTNQSRSLTKARDGRRTGPGHKGGIPLDLDGLPRPMILLDEQMSKGNGILTRVTVREVTRRPTIDRGDRRMSERIASCPLTTSVVSTDGTAEIFDSSFALSLCLSPLSPLSTSLIVDRASSAGVLPPAVPIETHLLLPLNLAQKGATKPSSPHLRPVTVGRCRTSDNRKETKREGEERIVINVIQVA
jgi:hypothetical protein